MNTNKRQQNHYNSMYSHGYRNRWRPHNLITSFASCFIIKFVPYEKCKFSSASLTFIYLRI